jgi:hypothetical protein
VGLGETRAGFRGGGVMEVSTGAGGARVFFVTIESEDGVRTGAGFGTIDLELGSYVPGISPDGCAITGDCGRGGS